MHLQPVHWPDPARHVPLAAIPGVHNDSLDITPHDSVFHVAHDATIFRLRTIDYGNKKTIYNTLVVTTSAALRGYIIANNINIIRSTRQNSLFSISNVLHSKRSTPED